MASSNHRFPWITLILAWKLARHVVVQWRWWRTSVCSNSASTRPRAGCSDVVSTSHHTMKHRQRDATQGKTIVRTQTLAKFTNLKSRLNLDCRHSASFDRLVLTLAVGRSQKSRIRTMVDTWDDAEVNWLLKQQRYQPSARRTAHSAHTVHRLNLTADGLQNLSFFCVRWNTSYVHFAITLVAHRHVRVCMPGCHNSRNLQSSKVFSARCASQAAAVIVTDFRISHICNWAR